MGNGKGKMCMCRDADMGAYEIGNVRIDFNESNGHEKAYSGIAKNGTRWKRRFVGKVDANDVDGMFSKGACFGDPADILECKQEMLDENNSLFQN
jgi:hypothetical protein